MLNKKKKKRKRKSKWTNVSKHLKVRTTQNKNWNQRQIKLTQILAKQNPKPCRYRLGTRAASQAVSVYGIWGKVPGSISRLIWWHGFNTSEWALNKGRARWKWAFVSHRSVWLRSSWEWEPLAAGQTSAARAFGAPKPWKAARFEQAGHSGTLGWVRGQVAWAYWQQLATCPMHMAQIATLFPRSLPRLLSKHSLTHKMRLRVK